MARPSLSLACGAVMELLAGYGDASSDDDDSDKVPEQRIRAPSMDLTERIKGASAAAVDESKLQSKAEAQQAPEDQKTLNADAEFPVDNAEDSIPLPSEEAAASTSEETIPSYSSARLESMFPAPLGDCTFFRARLKDTIKAGVDVTSTIMAATEFGNPEALQKVGCSFLYCPNISSAECCCVRCLSLKLDQCVCVNLSLGRESL
jgi:hypothetical protein